MSSLITGKGDNLIDASVCIPLHMCSITIIYTSIPKKTMIRYKHSFTFWLLQFPWRILCVLFSGPNGDWVTVGWHMGEVWMPCSSPVASGTWRISKDGALTRRWVSGGGGLMVVAWRWGLKKILRGVGFELVGLKKGWRFLGAMFVFLFQWIIFFFGRGGEHSI